MSMLNVFLATALVALTSLPAFAADTNGTGEDDPIDTARAQIDAEDWTGAIATLISVVADGTQDADAYNLLGYASRKSGALEQAEQYYNTALSIDPAHLGALEYQGELFLMTDRIDLARANLDKLVALCGSCEEQADLAEALAAAGA